MDRVWFPSPYCIGIVKFCTTLHFQYKMFFFVQANFRNFQILSWKSGGRENLKNSQCQKRINVWALKVQLIGGQHGSVVERSPTFHTVQGSQVRNNAVSKSFFVDRVENKFQKSIVKKPRTKFLTLESGRKRRDEWRERKKFKKGRKRNWIPLLCRMMMRKAFQKKEIQHYLTTVSHGVKI